MSIILQLVLIIIAAAAGILAGEKINTLRRNRRFNLSMRMFRVGDQFAEEVDHKIFFIKTDLNNSARFKQLPQADQDELNEWINVAALAPPVKCFLIVDQVTKTVVSHIEGKFHEDGDRENHKATIIKYSIDIDYLHF